MRSSRQPLLNTMLISPIPHRGEVARGRYLALIDIRHRLELLSAARIAALIESIDSASEAGVSPTLLDELNALAVSGSQGDRIDALLCRVAASGRLAIFVRAPGSRAVHSISVEVWQGLYSVIAEPTLLLRSCHFAVVESLLRHKSLEVECSGAALLVDVSAAKSVLGIGRPPGVGTLKQAGKMLVERLKGTHRRSRMKKKDFTASLKQDYPEASSRVIEQVWKYVTPQSWRKPGRRSERTVSQAG